MLNDGTEALNLPNMDGMEDDKPLLPEIPMIGGNSVGPRLVGKVIIITGCNSPVGIGRATAAQFAHNGARAIYLCDFVTDSLNAQKKELESKYTDLDVIPRKLDVGDEEDVKAVCDEAMAKFGKLDVMFANAAVNPPARFNTLSGEDFMKIMRVNCLGTFLCFKYAALAMATTGDGGSLIGTASVAAQKSNAGPIAYSASKAGMVALAQNMAFQLQNSNIRANVICPGLVQTTMTHFIHDKRRKHLLDSYTCQIPIERGALPDEIARVALFLASDDASYVNGQAWNVCGGLSAGVAACPGSNPRFDVNKQVDLTGR